jgi:transcriptional regulator with XRE-family HTH domain
MIARGRVAKNTEKEVFSEGLPQTDEFMEAWRKSAERREIGRRLEKMRRDAGITQVELANKMGKDQAFVARMESGRGNMPKAENVSLFATHCGFFTAYAFVEPTKGQLMLHELQPIGQSKDVNAELEEIHDVYLRSHEILMAEE